MRLVQRRERKQQRFKSPGSAQCFLSTHAALPNTFCHERHVVGRHAFKELRTDSSKNMGQCVCLRLVPPPQPVTLQLNGVNVIMPST